jgi:hypothetical protein
MKYTDWTICKSDGRRCVQSDSKLIFQVRLTEQVTVFSAGELCKRPIDLRAEVAREIGFDFQGPRLFAARRFVSDFFQGSYYKSAANLVNTF